jgi:hypothetical protein
VALFLYFSVNFYYFKMLFFFDYSNPNFILKA